MSFRDDAWFAGFADGEASFYVQRKRLVSRVPGVQPDGYRYSPGFVLGLRADDADVLYALAAEFGGRVQRRPGSGSRRPYLMWYVTGKDDLQSLVAYFDRFPLRAKKARDYAVWKEAVEIYVTGTASSAGLAELRDRVMAVRQYAEAA